MIQSINIGYQKKKIMDKLPKLPQRRAAQKWANALRSGKFSQTTGNLQDSTGYCCMGVGCALFIPKNRLNLDVWGYIDGLFPEDQSDAPEWLIKVNDYFHHLAIPFDGGIKIYLAQFNDQEGLDFNEIADLIEIVFIHAREDCKAFYLEYGKTKDTNSTT